MKKYESSYTTGGNVIGAATMENNMDVPQKQKSKLPYDLGIPLLGIYPDKKYNLKRYMHLYVHSSTTYNGQDMEAIWMSVNK